MADCYLTERQKDLLRSLVPGLNDGTVESEWIFNTGDGSITYVFGINASLWNDVWKGVTEADFDAFVDCNFLRRKGGTRYTLNAQKIIEAVESNFGESDQQLALQDGLIQVVPLFGPPAATRQFQCDVFMLMPFRDEFRTVYSNHIVPLTQSLNLDIKLGDDFFSRHDIIREIWSAIYNSKFVIADCTGKNTNVFYELGIAHTLGKPAIMIAQSEDDIPFDVRGKRYIIYENSSDGLNVFEQQLKTAIMKLISDLDEQ